MRITVHAGLHARTCCPVHVTLPIESSPLAFRLIEDATGQVVPCQWKGMGDKELVLTWLLDALDAGETRTYTVGAGLRTRPSASTPPDSTAVELEALDGQVRVLIGGRLFTSYNHAPRYPRPFLYPVGGPFGHGITRNYPMKTGVPGESSDHPHHRSLYTAFGDVNGVDNWSEMEGHGRILHRTFSALESGPAYGRIVAENDWLSHSGETVVTETREMVFYNLPACCTLLDYTVTFHAGDQPVTFGDTKEGGILSVRVASTMDVARRLGGQIANAYGGINEGETWGKPSPWCDYSGPVAGRTVGIAILDHPHNLRHPTQWHVRDYGLMTANCFAWSYYKDDRSLDGSYTMLPHTDLTFRYRVYIHAGREAGVPARFADFAFPPHVTVELAQPSAPGSSPSAPG